jgi:hypothetical protein
MFIGVPFIENNCLKEDEFKPPLDESKLRSLEERLPIELPKEIEQYPLERKGEFQEPRLNKDLEGEGIIIDPLAFYAPYHYNPRDWGIYFRVNRINNDFNNFLNYLKARVQLSAKVSRMLFFPPYIRIIYFHELCHHVIEDIGSVSEIYYGGVSVSERIYHYKRFYPLFPGLERREEEGLCEYMAFVTQMNSRFPMSTHFNSLKNAFYSFVPPIDITRRLGNMVRKINLITISELFYYWNRQNDPIYKPKIYPGVGRKVGVLWQSFWGCHKNTLNVISPNKWGISEVYDRLFMTYK